MMLRAGSVLITYRLDSPPEDITTRRALATKIADHDLKFLTYQGPVNHGRGSVQLVDKGTYRIIEQHPAFTIFEFSGNILRGRYKLTAVNDDQYKFECEI